MAVLGISGKAGSGKDTLTKLILKNINPIFKDIPIEKFSPVDTPYNYLLDGTGWEVKRFAYKLKKFIAEELLGIDMEQLEDREFKYSILPSSWDIEKGSIIDGVFTPHLVQMTPRDLMIKVGDGMRKKVHPNIWVNSLFSDYQPKYDDAGLEETSFPMWMIPDTRYRSEAIKIRENNGLLIRINSKHCEYIDNDSETDLDNWTDWDYVVTNNSKNLAELDAVAKDIIEKLNIW